MKLNFIQILTKIYNKKKAVDKSFVRNWKYTDEEYFSCIFDVLKSTHSWRQYNGLIDGRVLNNKHNELCRLDVYQETYTYILTRYLKINKLKKIKFQSIDTSFIQNKQCVAKLGRNKYYKNKKGIKISTIVDINGIPLSLLILNGETNDCNTIKDTIKNMFIHVKPEKYKNHNRYKQYFLADKGYDSINNRNYLTNNGYHPIIAYNKRNTKDITKIKHMSIKEKLIYKKRIIVENYFSWIKMYPKINNIYEKSIKSYSGLLYLISSIIAINKFN